MGSSEKNFQRDWFLAHVLKRKLQVSQSSPLNLGSTEGAALGGGATWYSPSSAPEGALELPPLEGGGVPPPGLEGGLPSPPGGALRGAPLLLKLLSEPGPPEGGPPPPAAPDLGLLSPRTSEAEAFPPARGPVPVAVRRVDRRTVARLRAEDLTPSAAARNAASAKPAVAPRTAASIAACVEGERPRVGLLRWRRSSRSGSSIWG